MSAVAKSKIRDNYLTVEKQSKHLGSRLNKSFEGYKYKITNSSDSKIEIVTVSIENYLSGDVAYSEVDKSSIGIGLKTLGEGMLHAVPTLTLSLICGVVATPIKMVGNSVGNIGAKLESVKYDSKPIEQLILEPNQTVELKILGFKRAKKPIIKIYYYTNDSELKKY